MQRILDLGVLKSDIMLFGGPYSNLQALEALLEVAQDRSIAPSNMICTGDLVAYCANPVEVIERVRDLGIPLVAGNCEIQLAEGAADCGCGFEEGSACDVLSKGWYPYALKLVSPALGNWLGKAASRITFRHCGKRYVVIHGGAGDVSSFIWSTDANAVFEREIALIEAELGKVDVIIAGHSGIGFQRQVGQKLWCNAGVIGMPPNDGNPQSEYCILGVDGTCFHRLEYDFTRAADAMKVAGLVQGYEKALCSGIWPSQDVLPDTLKSAGV